MNWIELIKSVVLVVLGGGGFGFIEFLIKNHTDQKNRKEDKRDEVDEKLGQLDKSLRNHLAAVNAQWKLNYCDVHTKKIDDVGQAVNGLVRDRIIHNVNEYVARGGITVNELTVLTEMYIPYKNLGGNGLAEAAYKVAVDLPKLSNEEARKRDELRKNEVDLNEK